MSRWLSLLLLLAAPFTAAAQQTEHVFLITFDGLRWEELFTGADPDLIRDERYVDDPDALAARFWDDDPLVRRRMLMPFFWNTIATEGQLYGNRHRGSTVDVTNGMVFSYPGYNEILTGFADRRIDSNAKRPNPNTTVLEFIHRQPGFEGKVAAFGSWDVFPYIINEARSGVPVNAGFEDAVGEDLTEREKLLNDLQDQIPGPWSSVRLDAFTHHFALEYLKKRRPRVLYIAYGETDDFAHDGDYDAYLASAHRTDRFIADLWDWVQNDPQYRDRTTFVLTTDHGRGALDRWTDHGDDVPGATAIWVAVLGPDTPARGELEQAGPYYQNQVARTVAALLGLDYTNERPVGEALAPALGR
ncbi:MAG: phosphoglyceromutase [Bacteroidetes bacterium]|nr:phosphoglyceromutase [Rhodothermaceae bacterium RA]RMH66451.1 MAG: phosphoglyceromutase [Bacteroidota bacterium]